MQRSGVKDLGRDLEINFVRKPSRRAGIRLRLRTTNAQTHKDFSQSVLNAVRPNRVTASRERQAFPPDPSDAGYAPDRIPCVFRSRTGGLAERALPWSTSGDRQGVLYHD